MRNFLKRRGEPLTGKKRVVAKIFKSALNVLILLAVFWFGAQVGSGRLVWGRDKGYLKDNKNLPENLNYESVEDVYDMLRAYYDGEINQTNLFDGLKKGLAKATGDPFTEYLNQQEEKEFAEQLNGTFEGIGAELSKDGPNVIVVSPLEGFPAQKAGLKPRDIIAEIDGGSAYDISVSEAVKKIRGAKGTKVKLTIVRSSEVLKFEITRETIVVPSVKTQILDGNIGLLRISRFGDDTAKAAEEAAQQFKSKGVKGIILDLRGNPGGLLDASVDVSSLWLPSGKTVLVEKSGGVVVKTYTSTGNNILNGIKTVVLLDGGSASASEITAGALHDNNAAVLLGTKTFGKGSVQSLRTLRGGGLLKVTIARWFTPNGRNIDKEGIEPDTKLELNENDAKAGKDNQLEAAKQQF